MCCNNAFCAAEADVENFEAKQPPRQAEQPYGQQKSDKLFAHGQTSGGFSDNYSYERGVTNVQTLERSQFEQRAATSNYGHYDEPQVDVLRQSQRGQQLADAIAVSGRQN